jgi:hypothetical protein
MENQPLGLKFTTSRKFGINFSQISITNDEMAKLD